jgi:hypothetical protein
MQISDAHVKPDHFDLRNHLIPKMRLQRRNLFVVFFKIVLFPILFFWAFTVFIVTILWKPPEKLFIQFIVPFLFLLFHFFGHQSFFRLVSVNRLACMHISCLQSLLFLNGQLVLSPSAINPTISKKIQLKHLYYSIRITTVKAFLNRILYRFLWKSLFVFCLL